MTIQDVGEEMIYETASRSSFFRLQTLWHRKKHDWRLEENFQIFGAFINFKILKGSFTNIA